MSTKNSIHSDSANVPSVPSVPLPADAPRRIRVEMIATEIAGAHVKEPYEIIEALGRADLAKNDVQELMAALSDAKIKFAKTEIDLIHTLVEAQIYAALKVDYAALRIAVDHYGARTYSNRKGF